MNSMLLWTVALGVAALGAAAVVRNRVIHRRIRFTLVTLLAIVALHLAAHHAPPLVSFPREQAIEELLFALALINLAVALLFNPWFQDRTSDRSPAIVQDTIVLAMFGAAAVFLLQDSTFLTASAIVAAAVGFALQETLANAFAGLAIQVEKPFRVGHWVSVADHEGAVAEVTWRATKIRTKAGNLVVIPNNMIAREAINNYSEPALPTRGFVEVGAAYGTPPNVVSDALMAATRQVPRLLKTPAPDVLLHDFGASALIYRARFWIADFSELEVVSNEVRRAIYYEFRRRGIEIPWPIQIEYHREERALNEADRIEQLARAIAATPLLADLAPEAHRALAASSEERIYGDGEVIVREGEPGASMFLVQRGSVAVVTGPDGREIAVTHAGGYFGEMSLLTGEPRSATIRAKGDCTVMEITADAFGAYIRNHPEVAERLASAAAARRRELDAARPGTSAPADADAGTLVRKIRKFFGLATPVQR
jgi:small-conductance mechanosensitive channel/CRP-like cAMP-binding protein